MNKRMYEKPVFQFQELKLMERVADTCWGAGHAWYDKNGNEAIEPEEIVELPGNGCSGYEDIFAFNFEIHPGNNTVNTKDSSLSIQPIIS